MKIKAALIWTAIIVFVGNVLNKIITKAPEAILPSPRQQLNTNFAESKVIFKFVNTNNLSASILIICTLLLIAIWYKTIKKKGE